MHRTSALTGQTKLCLTNNFAMDAILLISESQRPPKTSLSQFGRGQSLQVEAARTNEELDVLEEKLGFVVIGVLPRPKKEGESQNDHIGHCLVKKVTCRRLL